jgi:hypothetical protein
MPETLFPTDPDQPGSISSSAVREEMAVCQSADSQSERGGGP